MWTVKGGSPISSGGDHNLACTWLPIAPLPLVPAARDLAWYDRGGLRVCGAMRRGAGAIDGATAWSAQTCPEAFAEVVEGYVEGLQTSTTPSRWANLAWSPVPVQPL